MSSESSVATQFSQTRRALGNDTSRLSHLVWLLTGLLLAGWMAWFLFGSVTVYETSKRARLEVRQASHHVAAQVASKVVANSLAIGREVQAGDVLVELDASAERLRLQEEEARLAGIPPQIASLKEEIKVRQKARDEDLGSALAGTEAARFRNAEAAAALDFARDTERRVHRLSAVGTVSEVEANRAISETRKLSASRDALASDIKRAEREAQARAHQNDAQIESLRRTVLGLEGDIATTEATIGRLKVEIEKHVVRAPIAGRVGDVVPLPPGAYVAEGQRLATIVPAGELIIVADFSPAQTLGRVRPGQPARLRLDAFPWTEYGTVPAVVSRVATEVRDNLVRVEFALDPVAAKSGIVQHGLLGSVEVSVEQASPAVLVLRAAGLLLSNAASGDAEPPS
jgi:membrane fusion protein, adhesin transport system